jgi:glycyl-tRNA synthetase
VDGEKLRFRQHERDEMAHYAADCWDAEALLSFGWTEIVGIADRGCWDLSRHISFSGVDMSVFKRFDAPHEVERDVIKPKYGLLGPKFKALGAKIGKALEATDPSMIVNGSVTVEVEGTKYDIGQEMFDVARVKEKVSGVKVIPHVIEPSHGLDRITYACLEHAYDKKEDMETLRLSSAIAPIKFGVFPLMARDGLDKVAMQIDEDIRYTGIETYYDDSGSIGRRYARMDEIGTPYCITVDYQTLEDGTVTIRERDSQEQVRVKVKDLPVVTRAVLCGANIEQFVDGNGPE